MERVAEALGFAETASFSRAFKRWKGMSPLRGSSAPGQSEQLFNHDFFNRVDLNSRPFRQIVEAVIGALYRAVLQGKA